MLLAIGVLLLFWQFKNASYGNNTLKPGDSIPTPSGNPILTITGLIGNPNEDESIVMDIPTLESVGTVELHLKEDPFEKREVVYKGVLWSDLLDVWQVAEDAKEVQIIALDNFSRTISIEELRKYPIIMALRADGEYLSSDYGPARVMYPIDTHTFEESHYRPNSVWQIAKIDVR